MSVSSTISYAESFGPEAVRPGEAALRGSSRVVPGYWGVRPVRHQPGTPIIPKSSVRRASHPKGCGDLRKAELGSRCIRTRDKDTREAVVERAVGQYAGPASNRTIRRSTVSEPSGKLPRPSRTVRQSDTRKPSGSRRACAERPTIRRASRCRGITKRSAERAVAAETRTNRRASRRAAAGQAPSTKRSVERAVAAEPRTIRCSSRSQRAPQISNRTP